MRLLLRLPSPIHRAFELRPSTVLELLNAQAELVQAQADLVQARYAVRLSRAGLEAILGRRLSNDPERSLP
jgi:outer membrane protein TolC